MTTMNNEDPADPSVHEPLISLEDIRGAVARGWCHPANEHKAMDPPLALAIADEVHAALYAAQQPAPQSAEDRARDKAYMAAMSMPVAGVVPPAQAAWTGPFAYTGAQLLASQPANDELPEPVARIASLANHQGGKWYALEPLVSNPLTINTKVYTADQVREAIAAERALLLTDIAALREALDEAATDCELHPLYLGDSATLHDIIRAGWDAAFVTGLARGLREASGSAAEKEQPK